MSEYIDSRKILIETYRKFEIFFNTEEETFYCVSDYYDTDQKKKSYSASKKSIDEWIKEHSTFKPFIVIDFGTYQRTSRYDFPISNELDVKTITGIRRDKRFVIGTEQISEYDEKKYCLPLPENEPVFEEMKPVLETIKKYEAMLKQQNNNLMMLSKKLKIVTLKEHKKSLDS